MSPRALSTVIVLGVALGAVSGGAAAATGATTPEATTAAPTATTPAPAPAPTPVAPKATTSGAEAIGRTTGTVTGTVTPGNAESTYHFEYGTSSSYGLKTPDTAVPAGADAVAVKRALTGLTVETTYNYRLVVTNAAGTARGANRVFKTTANPKPPSVSTQAPINAAPESATFVARVNPQGQETAYWFQYGTTTKYGSKSPEVSAGAGTSTVTVNQNIAPLPANAKIYFRVAARNAKGTTYGSRRTFTTPRGVTGVSFSATPSPVLWAQNVALSGTVGGAGVGGVGVALLRQDFPFTGPFNQVATQTTSSAGAFAFTVGPLFQAAKFQVRTVMTVPVTSGVVGVDSRLLTKLRVSARKRTSVELTGLIYPLATKARVSIERKTPKGRWVRVKRIGVKALKERARFRTTVPRISRKSTYRAIVTPNDAGAHVKTTTKTVTVAKRR